MASRPQVTAAQWEIERIHAHMNRAQAAIAAGNGMAAALPHMQRARQGFLRAFGECLEHPVVAELLARLNAMESAAKSAAELEAKS